MELAALALDATGMEMDDDGNVLVDFEGQLEQVAVMSDQTFDLVNWLTQSDTQAWLEAVKVFDLPVEDLTNDQLISQRLLESGVTSVRIPLLDTIDSLLIYYGTNKDELDTDFAKSMNFKYDVIDSFKDSGNKVPSVVAHNAVFIDCHYLHKDIYQMIFDLAIVLKDRNYGLFVLARQRLNELLVYVRDDLNVCEFVPEVDIVVKDQMSVYSKGFVAANAELRELQDSLRSALRTNIDGSGNPSEFSMTLPTLAYIEGAALSEQMMQSVNGTYVVNMVLLSTIVIYSLMLADVQEQTYQFAMMRALGFEKDHVVVFVILQAFSFALPGVLLGLLVSLVLNDGFRAVLYVTMQNGGAYGLPLVAVLATIVMFGFFVPVASIYGPTKEALTKNLRASLDASRRNGEGEGVSATVQKLQDWAMSRREILLGIFLVVFGVCTYYLIPLSLLYSNFGLFFFVMNTILTGLSVGMILLAVITMLSFQKGVLQCILCCRPKDRVLAPLIVRRLESG